MKNFIFTLLFLGIYGISAAQSSIASEINLGEKALAKGDYKEASAHFQEVVYTDSLQPSKEWFYRGIISYAKNDYLLTIKNLTESMKFDSTNIDAYYLRGLSYYAFGKKYDYYQKVLLALKDMEKVQKLKAKYKDIGAIKPQISALYEKLYAQRDSTPEPAPDENKFVFAQEIPKPINLDEVKMAIGYPLLAQEAGIEGSVMVRVLVDKNGKPIRYIITKAGHPILQEAVEKFIDFVVFIPAMQAGKPLRFWVNIPFNFKLQ
jgi:TonB family protein